MTIFNRVRWLILLVFIFLNFKAGVFAQEHNSIVQKKNKGTDLSEYIKDTLVEENGNIIYRIIAPGIPPEKHREPIAHPARSAIQLPNVPAFNWSFGCYPTSCAMAAGYYDNNGYPNMYNGPTNGGVCPLTNASWPDTVINGETRHQCPLSATCDGLDGRTGRGHVDDYWIMLNDAGPDLWIANNWTEHTRGDCTADSLGPNQSTYDCVDGATSFFYYPNGAPLYDFTGFEPDVIDGCHGLRDFYESRGYGVTQNYSQLIYGYNGNTIGFTLDDYKAQIDAGRPVLIHITGHVMLGVGYESVNSDVIYLHDTWDYSLHSMDWGGSYSGNDHFMVTVIEL